MNDTPPDVAAAFTALFMARTPSDRVTMACEMFDLARTLVIAGIRADRPDISEDDLRVAVFERTYGGDFSPEARARIIARLRSGGASMAEVG